MKVEDLKPDTNADLKVRVCSSGGTRKVKSKKGYDLYVCSFLLGDETGTVEFSAFGKDIYQFEKLVGKVIKLNNIWVKEWRGKLQISKGRDGSWEEADDPDFPLTSEIVG
ncbi:hypothetical protein GF325_10100 [Candidatus Bathyarchaeota archaeon]|nr:hypothetical protein [Candidatus Bathyarchaeota archaeon]